MFNPDQLKRDYGDYAGKVWAKSRLRDRIDAIVIHEECEAQSGTHEDALALAPQTRRPVRHEAREILRAMEEGWGR